MDEFQCLFLDFLADRAQRMGSDAGGLHQFYLRRPALRRVFQANEEAVLAAIIDDLPRYGAYVEIGAGFGQLCCWLALQGLHSVAVERDASRYAGLEAFQSCVRDRWPQAAAYMRAVRDAFPCSLGEVDRHDCLILASNLIHGASFDGEQKIIDGIGAFSAALIDTARFCRERSTEEEWTHLDDRFAAVGLRRRRTWHSAENKLERLVWYCR